MKVITFDCYGTLIDWETGIAEAFAKRGSASRGEVLDAYHAVEREIEKEWRPYREVLRECALRVGARLGIDAGDGSFLPGSLPSWKPFPDTNAALIRLAAAGIELGILSNVDDDLLAATRRHLPVEFGIVVTAARVRSYKPGRAHFDAARAEVGDRSWLHAAASWYHDIVPARSLGIDAAWINRTAERRGPEAVDPRFEVRDLAALAGALSSPAP